MSRPSDTSQDLAEAPTMTEDESRNLQRREERIRKMKNPKPYTAFELQDVGRSFALRGTWQGQVALEVYAASTQHLEKTTPVG